MPPPAGDNHGWVRIFAVRTGFCDRSPCQHISRISHIIELTTAECGINYKPKVIYFVPEPNMVGGVTGRIPGERPHDGIAGESPA